jgi:hypothetical protein
MLTELQIRIEIEKCCRELDQVTEWQNSANAEFSAQKDVQGKLEAFKKISSISHTAAILQGTLLGLKFALGETGSQQEQDVC